MYDRILNFDKNVKVKKTVVFVCTNHLMHAISRYLHKKVIQKHIIQTTMFSFAQLVETCDKEDFEELCSKIICLFGDQNLPEELCDSYAAKLAGRRTDFDKMQEDYEMCMRDDETMKQMFPKLDPQLQRDKSKFFLYFR